MTTNSKIPGQAQTSAAEVTAPVAEDPVAKMKATLSAVSTEAAGEVDDVQRTAAALSTTWNRLANNTNTQKLRPVSDARAEKLISDR